MTVRGRDGSFRIPSAEIALSEKHMANDNSTLSRLQEQVECYRRLAKLAELQHAHVEQNQIEPLLDVLQSRRAVLDQIARIEQAMGSARARWSDHLHTMEPDHRRRAEDLLAETRRLLEQITDADRNDVMLLQQRKLNLGREIRQTMAARTVNRTYGAAAYGNRVSSNMDVQR